MTSNSTHSPRLLHGVQRSIFASAIILLFLALSGSAPGFVPGREPAILPDKVNPQPLGKNEEGAISGSIEGSGTFPASQSPPLGFGLDTAGGAVALGNTLLSFPNQFQNFGTASITLNPARHGKINPVTVAPGGSSIKGTGYTFGWNDIKTGTAEDYDGTPADLIRNPRVSCGEITWTSMTKVPSSSVVSWDCSAMGIQTGDPNTALTTEDGTVLSNIAYGGDSNVAFDAERSILSFGMTFDFGPGIEDETPGTYYVTLTFVIPAYGWGLFETPATNAPAHLVTNGPYSFLWAKGNGVEQWIWQDQTPYQPEPYSPVYDPGHAIKSTKNPDYYVVTRTMALIDPNTIDYINSDGQITVGFGTQTYYLQADANPATPLFFDDPGYFSYSSFLLLDYVTCSVTYVGTAIPASSGIQLSYRDTAGTLQTLTANAYTVGQWWDIPDGDYRADHQWTISAPTLPVTYVTLTARPKIDGALYLAESTPTSGPRFCFDRPSSGDLPLSVCGYVLPYYWMLSPDDAGDSITIFFDPSHVQNPGLPGQVPDGLPALEDLGLDYYSEDPLGSEPTKLLLDIEITDASCPFDFFTYTMDITYNFFLWDYSCNYVNGLITHEASFLAADMKFIGPRFDTFIINDGPYVAKALVDNPVPSSPDTVVPLVRSPIMDSQEPPQQIVDADGFAHWRTVVTIPAGTPGAVFPAQAGFTVRLFGILDIAAPEVPNRDALVTGPPQAEGFRGMIQSDKDAVMRYFDFFKVPVEGIPDVEVGTVEHPTPIEEGSWLKFTITFGDENPASVSARLYWQEVPAGGTLDPVNPSGHRDLDRTTATIPYVSTAQYIKPGEEGLDYGETWAFWIQFVDGAGNWATTRAYYIYFSGENIAPVVQVGEDYTAGVDFSPFDGAAFGNVFDGEDPLDEVAPFNPLNIPAIMVTVVDANMYSTPSVAVDPEVGTIGWGVFACIDMGASPRVWVPLDRVAESLYRLDANTAGGATWASIWTGLADDLYSLVFFALDTRGNPSCNLANPDTWAVLHLCKDRKAPDITGFSPAHGDDPYVVNAPFPVSISAADSGVNGGIPSGIYLGAYSFDMSEHGAVYFWMGGPNPTVDLTTVIGVGINSNNFDHDQDTNTPPVDFWNHFTATPEHGDGMYECVVGVFDLAWNLALVRFMIQLDTHSPEVSSLSLVGNHLILGVSPPTFLFSASDALPGTIAGISLDFTNGPSVTIPVISGTSDYSYQLSPAEWSAFGTTEGEVTATLTVRDGLTASSNVVTRDFKFTRDILAPRLVLTSPLSGSTASDVAPSYAITLEEPNLVSLYYTLDDGQTTRPITALSGVIDQALWDDAWAEFTTVKFVAIDDAGNVATVSASIKRDDWFLRSGEVDLGMFIGMPWQVILGMAGVAAATFVIVDRSNRKAKQKVPARPIGRVSASNKLSTNTTTRRNDAK